MCGIEQEKNKALIPFANNQSLDAQNSKSVKCDLRAIFVCFASVFSSAGFLISYHSLPHDNWLNIWFGSLKLNMFSIYDSIRGLLKEAVEGRITLTAPHTSGKSGWNNQKINAAFSDVLSVENNRHTTSCFSTNTPLSCNREVLQPVWFQPCSL